MTEYCNGHDKHVGLKKMASSFNPVKVVRGKNAVHTRVQVEGQESLDSPSGAHHKKTVSEMPRHRAIYEELLAEIQSGVYKPGERLPSEAILCERFQASRITVAKAFQSLQRENLVTRRPGSGTYVEKPAQGSSLRFGVLIPDFGSTDIFEPICQGIMRSPAARSHSLTWGSSTGAATNTVEAVEQLCQQYIAERVSGVFFAPSEFSDARDESNRRIAGMLERAGIPVVLLDRDFEHYPDRSNFDLVGIDNHCAGYILTRHLLQAGSKRIVFAARSHSAGTVQARADGYRDALYSLYPSASPVLFFTDFSDPDDIKRMLDRDHPDGIVCATDITAARIMQVLVSYGIRIPADIRMVGIDDVSYAKFLPTPLTTLRQNCAEIGAVAMSTMLDRISCPKLPIRDVLLRGDLIVRASCGSKTPEDYEV
jgi:GntR family transcriptional regulator, arabinose operon transcriptional repressor